MSSGFNGPAAVVLRGDARNLPLPDASVDLIVTSPPYFGLRSYQDGGEHYAGQIGAEPTPREFVDALLECTREWMRVLKPEGSLWVNLGDKYSTGNSGESRLAELGERWAGGGHSDQKAKRSSGAVPGMPTKTLLGLPWRYAIGCIDDLGLILRAEVIWSKANPMPESVTDRVRRFHEQWFHLVKQPKYFAGVDEIREPHIYPNDTRHLRGGRRSITPNGSPGGGNTSNGNPLGKLPSSVWEIASQPLHVPDRVSHARCCDGNKHDGCEQGIDHFAAFPFAIPRRIILGWSPSGICVECGEGRRPVAAVSGQEEYRDLPLLDSHKRRSAEGAWYGGIETSGLSRPGWRKNGRPERAITGYACACPEPTAPTRPAVVLDPFGGTGTTSLVASTLGRRGISVDMSADYGRIAQWRTTDPGERARALGVPKPAPVPQGQASLSLFGEEAS